MPSWITTATATAAAAIGAVGTACAPDDDFTLELSVHGRSALSLSVAPGAIEQVGATSWRVVTTWNTYEEARSHPGVTLSSDRSDLTVRVRDCRVLDPESRWLGIMSIRSSTWRWTSTGRSRWS